MQSNLFDDGFMSGAIFNKERTHRYLLNRIWDSAGRMVTFGMLNPSTADENKSDPTVTRCLNFARAWGFGGLYVVNLFALMSTEPRGLLQVLDPVGCSNDENIRWAQMNSDMFVCAWGAHENPKALGELVRERANKVYADITARGRAYCIKRTASGHPGHPLYLPSDSQPIELLTVNPILK